MDGVDVAVIGGGVVGCAVAAAFARTGQSVVLLEAGPRLAEGVTSRNSGVVHSGLYSAPGSLKAQLCVRGNPLLYEWASKRGVPHAKLGKLVVGEPADVEQLAANARACGAPGVQIVGRDFICDREPSIEAQAALWCPETGIVDPVELARSYAQDAIDHGALVLTHARVTSIAPGWIVRSERGELQAGRVVNAAGLYADEIAALAGIAGYRIHPWRGDYFRYKARAPFRHLIYPVRKKGAAGLGVHVTLDLAGRVRLGPDVELAGRKDDFTPREDKLDAFVRAARAYLGPVEASQLEWDGCGIRPKLRGPADKDEKDFVIREDKPGFVNLVGMESPGLTAALAIAERVLDAQH